MAGAVGGLEEEGSIFDTFLPYEVGSVYTLHLKAPCGEESPFVCIWKQLELQLEFVRPATRCAAFPSQKSGALRTFSIQKY